MSRSIRSLRGLRRMKYTNIEEMAMMAGFSRMGLSARDISHIETPGRNPVRDTMRKVDCYLRMLGYRLDIRALHADEPIEPTDPLDQSIDPSIAEGNGDMGEHHREGPDREAGGGVPGVGEV